MNEMISCPPKKRAAATRATRAVATWFCRGLSVPCSSGRRGHIPTHNDPLSAIAVPLHEWENESQHSTCHERNMSHNTYRFKQHSIPPFLPGMPTEPTVGNENQREVCFGGSSVSKRGPNCRGANSAQSCSNLTRTALPGSRFLACSSLT
jgi:hypothetical protein